MTLDAWTVFLLLSLGVFCGAMSAVIGGASILVFPALIAMGLDPVQAAITILVSLMPSGFAAAYYDRTKLPPFDRPLIILIVTSVVFASIGAVLLLSTPLATFKLLVPVLLAFATLVFAFAGRIARSVEHLAGNGGDQSGVQWRVSTWGMIPVATYTGYFGAGVGVMLLAVLSIGSRGDYRIANAVKNLLIGMNNVFATAVYAIAGVVLWPVVGIMICGTLVGAWIGTSLAKIARRDILRVAIITVSCGLTLLYTYRFWIKPFLAA